MVPVLQKLAKIRVSFAISVLCSDSDGNSNDEDHDGGTKNGKDMMVIVERRRKSCEDRTSREVTKNLNHNGV